MFTAHARYVTVRDLGPGPWCLLERMPQHVSVYQFLGMSFLVLVTVAWGIGLAVMLRRGRVEAAMWRAQAAYDLPHQRQVGPERESVELTSVEQDEFAGLVRRLSDH
ncbi:hypothetical protein SALBM311S_04760 [Streptomyces alboniger]